MLILAKRRLMKNTREYKAKDFMGLGFILVG